MIRQLVLAKSIYLHGCDQASRKDSVSRMLAIHHFDNAIETVLKCVVAKQDIKPKHKYFYFEELLQKVNDLPLKEQISGLHQVRNMMQHHGDIPSVESVIKYKGYTEDFLKNICWKEFNLSFEELYLSGLVENASLRERLLKAERAFGNEHFKECINLCDEVLIEAVFDEGDLFYSAGILTGYWGAADDLKTVLRENYLEKYKEKEYYELVKELRGAIVQWGQATTGMQFLGEYRMDFLKHRQIVETLETATDKQLKEAAEFCLRFVINLVLKWQAEGIFIK